MSEASRKSDQGTSADSTSATSSPGSEAGHTRCGSQGLMTGQCGPPAAHASPSAGLESGEASTTRATSGRKRSASSRSVALQRSLGSRLRTRLSSAGSTWLRVTWRVRVTPSRRQYFRLRASARRTRETGCTSWPTPTASGMHRASPSRGHGLLEQAWSLTSGQMPSGFCARTDKGAQLNPEFALWLMGFPPEWARCTQLATQLCRSRRPSSSGPTSRRASSSGDRTF
jgi:hypothetical protein